MNEEGKYKYDPGHNNEPKEWEKEYHRTEKGWSDAELGNSPGESSLIGVDKRLSKMLGIVVESVSQAKIPLFIGRLKEKQRKQLESLSEEKLMKAAAFAKSAMRIDVMLTSNDDTVVPFPIYIEVDGSQHERNRNYKGVSQSHLDRCKDFCARVNQNALMIRVKSTPLASKQVEHILSETKRYSQMIPKNITGNERKKMLQEYIDCMCFEFAGDSQKGTLKINPFPDVEIIKCQLEISQRLRQHGKRGVFNPVEAKLLNMWTRQRQGLIGFCRVLKSEANEKDALSYKISRNKVPYPFSFLEGVMELL